MRALITGVGGFVGRFLLGHLRACGDEVSGIARERDAAGLPPDLEVVRADLADRARIDEALRWLRPEAIYHLAAQSSSSESLADPWATLENNLRGQLNLLEAVAAAGLSPRILIVGSSEEYGHLRPEDIPTHEDVPLRPVTPYAVSKVAQDVMAYQYFARFGLPIVRVRPFGHTGPGHDPRFVIPSFARQLAEVAAGRQEAVLRVGNLDVWRDFTDVRDMVRAYRSVLLAGVPGDVYNLGRGKAIHLGTVLDDMIALSGLRVEVVTDPSLVRPADVPRQEADISKFRALCDWEPEIPWHTTLRDTLEFWRAQASVGCGR